MHFNPQLFKVSIIQIKLLGSLDFELSRFHGNATNIFMLIYTVDSRYFKLHKARIFGLTMTSPNQTREVLLFVCSEMPDETNLSSKLPFADRTRDV